MTKLKRFTRRPRSFEGLLKTSTRYWSRCTSAQLPFTAFFVLLLPSGALLSKIAQLEKLEAPLFDSHRQELRVVTKHLLIRGQLQPPDSSDIVHVGHPKNQLHKAWSNV